MGCELHITRAADWVDSSGVPVSLQEWLSDVGRDPEMRHDGFAETTRPAGETIRYENEGLCVWTTYPQHGAGGSMAWFDYRKGRVVVIIRIET
jgi:hypothetical protein